MRNFEIFDANQKLKPRSDKIWKNACLQISPSINPITLNAYVRKNRYNLNVDLKRHFGITLAENDSFNNSSLCQEVEYEACNSTKEDSNVKCNEMYCHLNIPEED